MMEPADKANLFASMDAIRDYLDCMFTEVDLELLGLIVKETKKQKSDDTKPIALTLYQEDKRSTASILYLETIVPAESEIHEVPGEEEVELGFADWALLLYQELRVAIIRFSPIYDDPDCPQEIRDVMDTLIQMHQLPGRWPLAFTWGFWNKNHLLTDLSADGLKDFYDFLFSCQVIDDYVRGPRT